MVPACLAASVDDDTTYLSRSVTVHRRTEAQTPTVDSSLPTRGLSNHTPMHMECPFFHADRPMPLLETRPRPGPGAIPTNTPRSAITPASASPLRPSPTVPGPSVLLVRRRGDAGAAPTVHAHTPGLRSAAASPLVWGAAPDTACGWGATAPWRVAQACVNSAPKNTIRAE
jgi:hypothetical protein